MTEYHTNLINILELGDLPEEGQEQLATEVEQILEVRVLNRAYDDLPQEKSELLDSYIQEGDPEQVMTFLQDEVPHLTQLFEEEIMKLKEELAEQKQTMVENIQKGLEDLEKEA